MASLVLKFYSNLNKQWQNIILTSTFLLTLLLQQFCFFAYQNKKNERYFAFKKEIIEGKL